MLVTKVLALVFGATAGATLYEFRVGQGFRLVWNKDIPWIMDDKVYVWPMGWLESILHEVREMATPGTIIASAMWGADVVHMSLNGYRAEEVLHYRSIPPDFANDMISQSGIPKHEWSRLMGHVHPEFYQMVFSSAFWRRYTNDRGLVQVIPLADWITLQLSGEKGHDRVMLHNQGAGVATSQLVNSHFNRYEFSEFAPVWDIFEPDELLSLQDDIYVVPCTHDSTLARLVLESTGLPWGLWTGSWYGVYRKITPDISVKPGEGTYNAGLVFEAMPKGGFSAISNIGMHGPRYKALKDAKGRMSYEDAAKLALARIDLIKSQGLIFSKELLTQEPDAFARAALVQAKDDLGLALATMVNTIAASSKGGLENAALALGVPKPCEVAIVGGFAENPAILRALDLYGIRAVVPHFAGMATHAGLAAQAMRLYHGSMGIAQALEMFPDQVLKG